MTTPANITPGPWRAAVSKPNRRFDTDNVYADSGAVCRMTGDVKFAYGDAHLIAAAPELYDALAAIIEGGQSDLTQARAALAKARGDQ